LLTTAQVNMMGAAEWVLLLMLTAALAYGLDCLGMATPEQAMLVLSGREMEKDNVKDGKNSLPRTRGFHPHRLLARGHFACLPEEMAG
jgi:hypothetical protein